MNEYSVDSFEFGLRTSKIYGGQILGKNMGNIDGHGSRRLARSMQAIIDEEEAENKPETIKSSE